MPWPNWRRSRDGGATGARLMPDRGVLYLGLAETLAWAGIFYIFPVLLVRWEAAFGWSRAEITGAITLALVVSAVASPRAGRRIDA